VLTEAFQYVDDIYLDMVETEAKNRRFAKPWGIVAAACICLALLLPVGAMAANWFGVRSLMLKYSEQEADEPAADMEESGEENASPDTSAAMIGLSGYQGSAEMQALEEWSAFQAEYLSVTEIDDETVPTDNQEKYGLYGAYDDVMAGKLEEIAEKNGLKLHETMNLIDQEELAYRVGGEFLGEDMQRAWSYMYDDGTFQFDGMLTGGEYPIEYQFRRAVKGSMDDAVLNVGHVVDYEEYQYVTACGEPVMLAVGPFKSLIYGEFDSCFISVNVLCGNEHGMTEKLLKEMADRIDFCILKDVKIPNMRGDSKVPK